MTQPELGKKIIELRHAKGFTQSELAEQCNLSLRTIQRIESTEVTPRSFTIKVIFSTLDYDIYNSIAEQNKQKKPVNRLENWLEQFYKYVLDFFNFKKNTMKKLSFLSTITLITITFFFIKTESKAQTIDNWFKTGSKAKSYEVGFDNSVVKTGKKSAYIESIDDPIKGFGTLMQSCDAKIYLGKRIKMTAYIKSENVTSWSGMWLRVDAKDRNAGKKVLSFDNMHDRPIKGTNDWTKCEIVLDVPFESGTLNFGVLLNGTGKVWFDKISFEVVDNISAKPTKKQLPEKPTNIDFEE